MSSRRLPTSPQCVCVSVYAGYNGLLQRGVSNNGFGGGMRGGSTLLIDWLPSYFSDEKTARRRALFFVFVLRWVSKPHIYLCQYKCGLGSEPQRAVSSLPATVSTNFPGQPTNQLWADSSMLKLVIEQKKKSWSVLLWRAPD